MTSLFMAAAPSGGGGGGGGGGAPPPPTQPGVAKRFANFNYRDTLIVGFAGHTQSFDKTPEGMWWIRKGCGVERIYKTLSAKYSVMPFPEDPGNDAEGNFEQCTKGVYDVTNGALKFVGDAFSQHKVMRLGAYGYSHGAGAVYLLSQELKAKNLDNYHGPDWTGYIDPIDPATHALARAETRIPVDTKYHFNRYQSLAVGPEGPHGAATVLPAGFNANRADQVDTDTHDDWKNFRPEGLDHTNARNRGIAEDNKVEAQLIASLVQAIPNA